MQAKLYMWRTLVILICLWVSIGIVRSSGNETSTRPSQVNVAAFFSFGSAIGKSAKPALLAAVDDVNSNPSVLPGVKINLMLSDTNCSGYVGTVEVLQLLEQDVIAALGPQCSGSAHAISPIIDELQMPLLSWATDPSLSASQFPYFIRTTISDYFQMYAIADLIEYYDWSQVIAIYADDDYGRNGISVLGDALTKKRAKISHKAPFTPGAPSTNISDMLVQLSLMESRIFVVHMSPDSGLTIFSEAMNLGMLNDGYVWIATDWLPSILDISESVDPDTMDLLQGVITLRHYTPQSQLKKKFSSRWKSLKDKETSSFNTYALYAYDSVWLLAHALDSFFSNGGNITFSEDSSLLDSVRDVLDLSSLLVFDQGKSLLDTLLSMNFTGLTGQVQYDSDRNLINPAFEILNIGGTGVRRIGYWSNHSSLSVVAPELSSTNSSINSNITQLRSVIWPGETTEKPRGWVFPNNGRPLQIVVPYRVTFENFVSKDDGPLGVKGYCIDVFEAAVNLLPYAVPHDFILYGDGLTNPTYNDLVSAVAQNEYDAAVGDITISNNRTKLVDFTQPYLESGLILVASVKKLKSSPWAFLKPFTWQMWCVTAAIFISVGAVVWVLEHRINEEFRGSPRQQLVTIIWFSLSTMFFAHRENTMSTLGRLVLLMWLFVVLIINSSYTAGLTSILTVQQLSSPVQDLASLISGSDPIGVQDGAFAYNYLTKELGVAVSRIRPLQSQAEYEQALAKGIKNGGVGAIVDEHAYINEFLTATKCAYTTVGDEITNSGWGFAFPKDSALAVDLSTAILQLSDNGDLQRIHEKWLSGDTCSSNTKKDSDARLSLDSFWGLFLICGIVCFISLIAFFWRVCKQYHRFNNVDEEKPPEDKPESTRPARRSISATSIKDLMGFVDKREAVVKDILRRKSLDHKEEAPAQGTDGQPTIPV